MNDENPDPGIFQEIKINMRNTSYLEVININNCKYIHLLIVNSTKKRTKKLIEKYLEADLVSCPIYDKDTRL